MFETMVINRDIQNAINDGAPAFRIKEIARSGGMATLEDATRRKVVDKVTSTSELRRIISDAELARV